LLIKKQNREGTVYFVDEKGEIVSKECRGCKEIKPLCAFYRHPKSLGGRKSKCIKCCKEYLDSTRERQKAYRESRREKQAAYFAEYYKEHSGLIRKRASDYYLRKRDDEDFKESRREYKRRWRHENPQTVAVENHLKAARMRGLIANWNVEEAIRTLEHFDYKCALTGEEAKLHFDHVIPLSTGQAGTVCWNMLPIKAELNISKSNKNIFEWFDANRDRLSLEKYKLDEAINYLASLKGVSVEEFKEFINDCHNQNVQEECV